MTREQIIGAALILMLNIAAYVAVVRMIRSRK